MVDNGSKTSVRQTSPDVKRATKLARVGGSPDDLLDALWQALVRSRNELRGGRPRPSISLSTLHKLELRLVGQWVDMGEKVEAAAAAAAAEATGVSAAAAGSRLNEQFDAAATSMST